MAHLARSAEHGKMIEFIKKELRAGRQAYFIFPLVNDSEEEGFTHLKSAVTAAETLANETFPEFKIGLLHGQLSSGDKATIMGRPYARVEGRNLPATLRRGPANCSQRTRVRRAKPRACIDERVSCNGMIQATLNGSHTCLSLPQN